MEQFLEMFAQLSREASAYLLQPMSRFGRWPASLEELTFTSVVCRMALALLLGGAIGLERGRKNRPAGFRTYMLVCMASALTMVLGQYLTLLAQGQGLQADMTRISAQVINGIGFLGAGTILVTEKQQVKGLTTAAGLWASACMGLALGAGFYECVILAFALIFLAVLFFPRLEAAVVERSRNMDFYVEVYSMEGIHQVIELLKEQKNQIYAVDIVHAEYTTAKRPNAVFSIRLTKGQSHISVIERLSRLDAICGLKEL